jgi:hypothetical protein
MEIIKGIVLDWINVVLLITAILNLALGLVILFNGSTKKINKVYFWNIVAIIAWVLAMFFFRSASQDIAVLWGKILYISPTFIASSLLYFTYIFPSTKDKYINSKKVVIFLINFLVVFLVIMPDFIIEDVYLRSDQEKFIKFGNFYFIYFLYTLGLFSFAFIRLFRKYINLTGKEKSQVLYLLIGYAIAANLAFLTNFSAWQKE